MSSVAALLPRREFVLPALVVAAPLLYFTLLDARSTVGTEAGTWIRLLGVLVGSLLVGYVAGVVFLAAVDVERLVETSAVARAAFRPGNLTLALIGVFVLGAATYILVTARIDVPPAVDAVLRAVGVVLGLPLFGGYAATFAVGQALGREPPLWFQFAAVGTGVALSALWTFFVATGLAGLVDVF